MEPIITTLLTGIAAGIGKKAGEDIYNITKDAVLYPSSKSNVELVPRFSKGKYPVIHGVLSVRED